MPCISGLISCETETSEPLSITRYENNASNNVNPENPHHAFEADAAFIDGQVVAMTTWIY
jgi:hypothetical protein